MGNRERARQQRIDAWLAQGGTVLAATERAARALLAAHHAARQSEGRAAWITPSIFAWEGWLREQWLGGAGPITGAGTGAMTGRMLMNPLQEHSLWSGVIGMSAIGGSVLHPRRLATAAQRAYRLLCEYAPEALKARARSGWVGDAGVFSEWLDAFELRCHREGVMSASRIAGELTSALRERPDSSSVERTPLLLVGFDRLLETQTALLDSWGPWHRDVAEEAAEARFVAAPDRTTEIEACVAWLRDRHKADAGARLLVVTTGLQERRGELERALLRDGNFEDADDSGLDFEFSLGVPLTRLSLVRSAILLLRWLHEPLSEFEVDWLLTSGHVASAPEEMALAEAMRELRRRGRERPEWRMGDFLAESGQSSGRNWAELEAWAARLAGARELLQAMPVRRSPVEWAGAVEELLVIAGWPGAGQRPLSSVAFQARERWDGVLEDCASLGFDGSEMEWAAFVETLGEAATATIFAAESSDAPVQITEPLESAGQLADGVWFLGADEKNWPGPGQPHPLLPIGLQREKGMPHASSRDDWELAQEATLRLASSGDEVIFSYARRDGDTENRPSRLVAQQVGQPVDGVGAAFDTASGGGDLTESFADTAILRFPHEEIGGGAATLSRQSLCPFQAFGVARLHAEPWEAAETGLNAKQRGQLLHAVLQRVWSGSERGGISSWKELQEEFPASDDLEVFVRKAVKAVMQESFDTNAQRRSSLPLRFPARYLELEEERLTRLVTEWLQFERMRLPFVVAGTEVRREVTIAGVRLKVRLDRLDNVGNGKALIVDYKSGDVGPKAWAGERPDDVQLPLYATFAEDEENLEGLVFARVRPGEKTKFCGRVRDAAGTLLAGLSGQNGLMKDPLTEQQMAEWRERIEWLGEDFVNGRAEADPKEPGKTCESCHLHAVCRIYESQPLAADPEEDASGESTGTAGGDDA